MRDTIGIYKLIYFLGDELSFTPGVGLLLSFSILVHAAFVASLNLFCICCTQSRPATIMRAIISGSVSLLLSSNSFLA